ncbi:hypothetical protein [Klebsiella sp. BIGb0407]|uniref:OspG family effector kinase n=1 Tax=Klebsiella sp. BIGb0407 TaxID=2940603 RepID=UPI0038F7B17E
MGKGSVSTVYDLENGYVEKTYTGYFTENNKSRLISAKNNAKGFNRYYGTGSATVKLTHNTDGEISVSVKLKKINGKILSDILSLKDSHLNTEIISKIESNYPEETLSRKLQEKGIIHHDINKGNIIYNEGEFFIIDFDSANFLSNGKKVSESQTESMKKKLQIVFNEVLREIK